MEDLFLGKLVRLTREEPEIMAKLNARWDRDSEFRRSLDDQAVRLWSEKKHLDWAKEHDEQTNENHILFNVRKLSGEQIIGFVSLFQTGSFHRDAWVGIGLGDRQDWGQGYGTDAMQLILRYAFSELNLYRVTLGVHAYNLRAIRSYEKAGFVVEGRERQIVNREGARHDSLVMGILRTEWLALQAHQEGEHGR
jgi:RimJ/RimL family protein N-acetyltransferase